MTHADGLTYARAQGFTLLLLVRFVSFKQIGSRWPDLLYVVSWSLLESKREVVAEPDLTDD